MTRPLVSTVICLSALLLSSCVIPADDEARAIDSIPEEWQTTSTTVAPAPVEDAPNFFLSVFYVDSENNLRIFERPKDTQPTLQEAIEAVFGSPTPAEFEAVPGIRNTLPPQANPDFPQAEGPNENGVLTLILEGNELSDATSQLPDRIRRVYSQIVCTMTAMEWLNVSTVVIQDESGTIQMTDGATSLEGPIGVAEVNECRTAEQLAEIAAEDAQLEEDGEATDDDG